MSAAFPWLVRTPPIGDWIRAQQAALQHTHASEATIRIADTIGILTAGSMGRAIGLSDATARAVAGITTGASYAASLASLGALAGPYGAAVGAVVGFGAGLVQGTWPVAEDTVGTQFATMLRNLTPGIRMRLWTWGHRWGAVCRQQFHEPPLPAWQFIGQHDVNEYGSAEIMAERCLQSLWGSDCWPDTNPPPSTLSAMPLSQLPPWAVYALCCYAHGRLDSQTLIDNPNAVPGSSSDPGTIAWEVVGGIFAGPIALPAIANTASSGQTPTETVLRNEHVTHPELFLWAWTHWSTLVSAIRARAADLGMNDPTELPVDPATVVLMTDLTALTL